AHVLPSPPHPVGVLGALAECGLGGLRLFGFWPLEDASEEQVEPNDLPAFGSEGVEQSLRMIVVRIGVSPSILGGDESPVNGEVASWEFNHEVLPSLHCLSSSRDQ